ncbi:hypothetical protein BC628DRAFT_1315551 [Trametes gibbosa]|nr:hypothetical protein BC628DRAFT_1315551 [Trametes gibbosa]UVI59140.1 Zn(2)-Cys(6)41 [Trametes gibbosa]
MAPTRTEKDSITEGETKQRRKPGRAPVSCAECRRLKLRCDRKVPCETCTKRGCATLCPDGSLPTTRGPKKAAADAEQLKKRVQELEAALRRLQGAVSDEPHPLLRTDSAIPPRTDSPPNSSDTGSGTPPRAEEECDEDADILDAFGTLTLGTRGEARFFGQTSRSEANTLFKAPERLAAYTPTKLPRLTLTTIDEAHKELDVFCTNLDVGEDILACLPPVFKALQLCEIFFTYSNFLWYSTPRDYIINEVIPIIYRMTDSSGHCHVAKKHGIALLCMIFALATLFDPNMPPYAAEAHEYYLIARVALRWAPPAYDTTLASIQALIYMSIYLEMSDCEPAHTGSHKAWIAIRQAASLGQSVSFYVNSSKWQLDSSAAAKRGTVFWQLATYDAWLSFGYGRPPCISMEYVDCDIPKAADAAVNEASDADYHVWSWNYTKLLHAVMAVTCATKPPTYAKVFELDKSIRDFPVPTSLRAPISTSETQPDTPALAMQRLFVTFSKESTLFNLHRPYFSLAVKEAPDDPLRHKYGPSVMTIYRSTWRILTNVQSAYRAAPGVIARGNLVWSHSLACAILLCLLITRASKSTLAGPCLMELDRICSLFEEAADLGQSQCAANNLEVMRKLRKQAQEAMTNVRKNDVSAVALELDRLGGKTQLIQTVGERVIHCPPRVRPLRNPQPPTFMAPGVSGPRIQSTLALEGDLHAFNLPAADSTGSASFLANGALPIAPVSFDFAFPPAEATAAGAFPMAQADMSAMWDYDPTALAGWDSSMDTWSQGSNPDPLQPGPNAADSEASWQALVEQLGI